MYAMTECALDWEDEREIWMLRCYDSCLKIVLKFEKRVRLENSIVLAS